MTGYNASAELLDRQVEYLRGLSDADFLFAAGDVLRALDRDPRLGVHLTELEHEADDLGRRLMTLERDGGDPGQMLEVIWRKLGHGLNGPQLNEYVKHSSQFELLYSDAEHPVILAMDPNAGIEDDSRVGRLIRVVSAMDVSEGHAIVGEHRDAFDRLKDHQQRVHAQTLREARTHPGVALLRLRCLAVLDQEPGRDHGVSSRPRDPHAQPALVVRPNAAGGGWSNLLDGILRSGRDLTDFSAAPAMIAAMRAGADRVIHELRGRLGTTRSRLAVIERYAARCEWHDRDRLRELADGPLPPPGAAAPASRRAREHALRDDLSRFLFDQGLNALSEAILGDRARADLFAPADTDGFVCEAKQYTDGTGLPSALRAAFRQALDTVGTLRGSGYPVEEAFVVLFRRGGPRALLPREPLPADGLAWHFVLINIADADQDASRNRKDPIEYTVDDLRALLIAAQDDRTPTRRP